LSSQASGDAKTKIEQQVKALEDEFKSVEQELEENSKALEADVSNARLPI